MKRILSYVLLSALLLTFFGCTKDKVYKIGVSQCSQDDWRTKMNDGIFVKSCFTKMPS